jgi:hypothetical protein
MNRVIAPNDNALSSLMKITSEAVSPHIKIIYWVIDSVFSLFAGHAAAHRYRKQALRIQGKTATNVRPVKSVRMNH